MSMLAELKHGLEDALESAADGWRRLRHQTAGALTRFVPGKGSRVEQVRNDERGQTSPSWALLAGDMFEDSEKISIRLEAPGMEKGDFNIEMHGDVLVISGEKRTESESAHGRYRVLECAYGSFSRTIPLPVPVLADEANVTYQNGVLKIDLPKAMPAGAKQVALKVK